MGVQYFETKDYKKIDFSVGGLPKGEYDRCNFSDCNFSNCDLSGIVFAECNFINCNLSLVKTSQAAFREVSIRECKILGVHFENCNPFLFSILFDHCMLNLASFYRLNLRRSRFANCNLVETDFTECDLSNSLIDNCDLSGAVFENTILEKADFRTSSGYSIDPELNRLRGARFSLPGIAGLLGKYGILID
jgi:uncharacterized protein YjbI with pentapeptide repeats